jgi:hypothetical protein
MKTRIKIIVLAITISAFPCLVHAQALDSATSGYKRLAEDFFKELAKGDSAKAVTEYFRTNPSQFQKKGLVDDFKSKFATLPELVGKYVDYQIVKSRLITERVGYVQAIASFEKQPVLFTFTVHKPADKWQAISVNVDFHAETFVPEFAK